MKPKSRKEILDICQNNFWKYSTLNKFLIIISVLLSAIALAAYICAYILPTIMDISNDAITGWNVVWRIGLAYLLYKILTYFNIFCASIGGWAMCNEENWQQIDFAKAWLNFYKYDDENFEK